LAFFSLDFFVTPEFFSSILIQTLQRTFYLCCLHLFSSYPQPTVTFLASEMTICKVINDLQFPKLSEYRQSFISLDTSPVCDTLVHLFFLT
jgi:hypothetical protein